MGESVKGFKSSAISQNHPVFRGEKKNLNTRNESPISLTYLGKLKKQNLYQRTPIFSSRKLCSASVPQQIGMGFLIASKFALFGGRHSDKFNMV